jgi:hypothetical protein
MVALPPNFTVSDVNAEAWIAAVAPGMAALRARRLLITRLHPPQIDALLVQQFTSRDHG